MENFDTGPTGPTEDRGPRFQTGLNELESEYNADAYKTKQSNMAIAVIEQRLKFLESVPPKNNSFLKEETRLMIGELKWAIQIIRQESN